MQLGDWVIWEMPNFSYTGFVLDDSQNDGWGSFRVTQVINRGKTIIVSYDSNWREAIMFPISQARMINDDRRIDDVNFLIDFALSDNDKETFCDLVNRYKRKNIR